MTKEQIKQRIEKYYDEEVGTNESETAMREITWEMYNGLWLNDREYRMTVEDGSVINGNAMDVAETIYYNYSESEWVGFMLQAEAEHGTYEFNPWGNVVITIKW